ncbi:MAG: c-type cytochrome biogenesis protein CcmI [Halioglobus sp.]
MTGFYLACGALVLLSAVFILLPRGRDARQLGNSEEENLEWYRLRERELAAESDPSLRDDARLQLLEDAALEAQSATLTAGFPRWLLLPITALLAAALYYWLGNARDIQIAEQLGALDAQTSPAEMEQLIASISERSLQRPDNLHYSALLARYYMGQEDFQQALKIYERILDSVPEDPQALAYAAQAEYLGAGRTLNDRARLRAEQALAADPRQRTALGLLGMASYEQGEYRAAIAYWQRLQAMESAQSESGQVIAGVIQQARQALAQQGGAVVASPPGDAAGLTAGVTVQITLPDDATVNAADTVFVFARNAASDSRMPIAVARLRGEDLPTTLRLDDSNSMAGQKLSETAAIVVNAQVSPDGRPGEAGATWVASAGPLAPGDATASVRLELAPN